MTQLSKNFSSQEFACKCGACSFADDGDPHLALLAVLEDVRAEFGPVHVSSGRRCQKHNEEVGGAQSSQHLVGTAADIVVHGVSPDTIHTFLLAHPLAARLGLGQYPSFTHIDVRGTPARW